MKKNEKGLDIDKTKPNLNINKDLKDTISTETNLNKNLGVSENKSNNKEKDRNEKNQSNKLTKPSSSSSRKEINSNKESNSPKLEKMSEENQRKGSFIQTHDKKIENSQNTNLTKFPLRKFQLDISEMIEKPQDKLLPKKPNSNLTRAYLLNRLIENHTEENILEGINFGLDEIHKQVKEGLIKNTINVSQVKKTVEEIILIKERKKNFNLEENLRQQKIKEIQDNKEAIGNKIKTLDENLKMIENEGIPNVSKLDINTTIGAKDLVDENIRKSRIKEIKQSKKVLEKKLYTLNQQVDELINEEEAKKEAKKFNLKQYLENFEKDKAIAEARAQKWEQDRKERILSLKDTEEKTKLKIKKKEEELKEQLAKQQEKRKKEYYENLNEFRNNRSRIHEEVMNLKEEWGAKMGVRKDYIHYKLEEDFRKKIEDQKNSEIKILREKKYLMKPILKEEIDEFSKKIQDEVDRKLLEREKQRLTKLEEILNKNENMPKPQTSAYQKIIDEEKRLKEIKEKEKLEKIYKNLSIKKFSKVVRDTFAPSVDENKKKEIEERIHNIASKSKQKKKHKRDKTKRILLKKPDPNKPKKYNWELKLNISDDNNYNNRGRDGKKFRSLSSKLRVNSLDNKDINLSGDEEILNNLNKRVSKSRSVEKRKPMEKHPDYLTEMRVQKAKMNSSNLSDKAKENAEKKWKKMINNEKYSLLENVEQIKIKANLLEQQAKMKEKFLQLNGGTEKNPEIGEDVSNMLIDAIKAKLTILESISKKK